jgi:hypothetical protein
MPLLRLFCLKGELTLERKARPCARTKVFKHHPRHFSDELLSSLLEQAPDWNLATVFTPIDGETILE